MLWQRFLVTPSVHFDCRLLLPEDKELNGSVPMTRPAQSLSLMAPIHTSYLHVPDPIDMLALSAAAFAAVLPPYSLQYRGHFFTMEQESRDAYRNQNHF